MKIFDPRKVCAVEPVTLIVLLLLFGTAVPSARPWNWFKKGPAEQSAAAAATVQRLEAERQAAQARADALQQEKEAAERERQAQKDRQLVQAQELTFGAAQSLGRVVQPAVEVRTASSMLQHALVYQSMALGELSSAQKAEVIRLIDLAVAGKEAEFQVQLAQRDAAVQAAEQAKVAAQQAAERAATELVATKGTVQELNGKLEKKITETVAATTKASEEEKRANSFSTQVSRLLRWALYAAVAYVLLVYVLPIVARAFPALKGLSQVTGWLAAPLHQMETRKKEVLAADLVGAHEEAKAWIEQKMGAAAREEFKKDVLSGWMTVKDGTAQMVSELKDSSLLRKRQRM